MGGVLIRVSRVTILGILAFFAVAIPCFLFERLFLYLSFNDIDSRIGSKSYAKSCRDFDRDILSRKM